MVKGYENIGHFEFGKRITTMCAYEKKPCKYARMNFTDGIFHCIAPKDTTLTCCNWRQEYDICK